MGTIIMWEYKIIQLNGINSVIETELNCFGADRWNVISITETGYQYFNVYLKRPIK